MTVDQLQSTGLFKKPFTGKQKDSLLCIQNAWSAWSKFASNDLRKLSYILATIFHETAATMLPIKERGGHKYLRSKKYWPYIGYGYVMLTWRDNYARIGTILGEDLVSQPEKALDPEIAAEIAVCGMLDGWFTSKKLKDYIDGFKCDYVGARKVINGTDRAELIAGYANKFEQALKT